MRQKSYIWLLLIGLNLGCEDTIEIDLPRNDERLVVNAIIGIDRSSETTTARVKTSLSSGFFDENRPISVTSVKLISESINEFGATVGGATEIFESETETGVYEINLSRQSFNTETTYYLSVLFNGRLYYARTSFVPATDIDNVAQGREFLFNDDEKELIVTFTDEPVLKNLYVFNFGRGNFITTEDTFFQGQQHSFSVFLDDNYKSGEKVDVRLYGADREFFNYINLLNEQANQNISLFETPAATIRGNIFDITDIDNRDQFDNTGATDTFALGYFAIVESSTKSIVLE